MGDGNPPPRGFLQLRLPWDCPGGYIPGRRVGAPPVRGKASGHLSSQDPNIAFFLPVTPRTRAYRKEGIRIIEGLKHLRFRGSEVLVLHTLDPFELTFPFEHAARFEDLETAAGVVVVPTAVRTHYLEQIQALVERYRRELRIAGIDYHLVDTSAPLDTALAAYLSTRGRRW